MGGGSERFMIKTTEDIIYNRLKSRIGFDKSNKHLIWLRQFGEPHHLFGSYSGRKTSDYCAIPLTREEHDKAEKNKSEFAIDNLHILILTLQKRIKELENNKSWNK